MDTSRPCTISESITESLKEMKLMRDGSIPKRSLNDLWTNLDRWEKDIENVRGNTDKPL